MAAKRVRVASFRSRASVRVSDCVGAELGVAVVVQYDWWLRIGDVAGITAGRLPRTCRCEADGSNLENF